jgi:hypothetical protein
VAVLTIEVAVELAVREYVRVKMLVAPLGIAPGAVQVVCGVPHVQPVKVPPLFVADTNARPLAVGVRSVMTGVAAADGPLLVTVTV